MHVLIVEDLNMKKLDSWIEFHYKFILAAAVRNIRVHFVLPQEPKELVRRRLSDVDFNYTVFRKWWNLKDNRRRNNIVLACKISKMLQRYNYDLVEFDFCYELSVFLIVIFAKLTFRKTKFLWRQHSESGMEFRNDLVSRIKMIFSKMRVLSWFIDMIIVLSEKQKDVFVSRKISSRKINVIPTGINLNKFFDSYNGNSIDLWAEFKKFDLVVLTVGSLIPEKGIYYLLQAAQIVLTQNFNVGFVVVGEGQEMLRLKQEAKILNIENNVIFTGLRNDIPELLTIADIFVLPTLSEAMSFATLEAMAAGKPIVASDVGGLSEVVRDKDNGFLVPPRDPKALSERLILLIKDKNARTQMGKKSRAIVEEKFNLDKSIDKTIKLIESVVDPSR